jgi:hypothetical protein
MVRLVADFPVVYRRNRLDNFSFRDPLLVASMMVENLRYGSLLLERFGTIFIEDLLKAEQQECKPQPEKTPQLKSMTSPESTSLQEGTALEGRISLRERAPLPKRAKPARDCFEATGQAKAGENLTRHRPPAVHRFSKTASRYQP